MVFLSTIILVLIDLKLENIIYRLVRLYIMYFTVGGTANLLHFDTLKINYKATI